MNYTREHTASNIVGNISSVPQPMPQAPEASLEPGHACDAGSGNSTAALGEYYRLPEPWVRFSAVSGRAGCRGFFNIGEGAVGFGHCAGLAPAAFSQKTFPDALSLAHFEDNSVCLPFDLDEVADNLRMEAYAYALPRQMAGRTLRELYYQLRPFLSVGVRKHLQRLYLAPRRDFGFPHLPVDRSVDQIMERVLALGIQASGEVSVPFIWFWPEGYRSCAVFTHDVESEPGRDFCSTLMDIDASFGINSAFQVVPEERYKVSQAFLDSLHQRGFEVNVHDLNHDGLLFVDERRFMQRVAAINRYGKQFRARGFRAGVMYRNQNWFHALDFEYEMSVPTTAHLDPQRGGCCTALPYFIGDILEIPLTTTQDYALFHLLGERSTESWRREIDLLYEKHALISILVHPDYIMTQWARDLYTELLEYITGRAGRDRIWLTTPGELNDWWRTRNRLHLERESGGWRIVGTGAERARVAFASLDENGAVQYSFENPTADKEGCPSHLPGEFGGR